MAASSVFGRPAGKRLAIKKSASIANSLSKQDDVKMFIRPQNATRKRPTNRHIVNSRQRCIQEIGRINIKSRKSKSKLPDCQSQQVSNPLLMMMINSLMLLLLILPISSCDFTPVCPRDTSPFYPCSCANGTRGLLIKCSRVNLASLSSALESLTANVEQLEIVDSALGRLFGSLFSDSHQFAFHKSLRELDVRNSALSQPEGPLSEELTRSLQYLQLDGNRLTEVPTNLVANLTGLKMLNLSANSLVSLEANSFSRLTNLSELDLSRNKISRLARNSFNSLNQLELLNLASNEINKLERNLFSFGRKLLMLDLSNNKLTSLDRQDFAELTSLESLRLANNQLASIPRSIFSRNAKLYHLDLSFNKLDDIDTYLFKSVRFLKDLNLSGNSIKELTKNTFSATSRLKRLDLSQNVIQALAPETFRNLEYMERLNVSRNQLVNISNEAFSHMFTVEIDLSHNRLQRIFYWAFRDISNISRLDLSHNQLADGVSQIAFESSDCGLLDLSHNLLEDVAKFPVANLTGVRWLDLSHNQIGELNKKSFGQKVPLYELHTIDLSHNNISQISGNLLDRLKGLRSLNLSHNTLRRLTAASLGPSPTLLELDLSHNNLVEVAAGTFTGLASMRELRVNHNRLRKMIPVPVALSSIWLEHNEIGQLGRSAFPTLNSLLELHLDYNRLASVEEGTFGTLLALRSLSMSYNNLSAIPAGALRELASLQSLRLNGNAIQRLPRRALGGLPIVFELDLAHNNISQLADFAFDGLLNLLKLNLSYNRLNELPAAAFHGLVSLQRLDLSHNQLSGFENKSRSAMEDLLSLEELDLSANKLSIITSRTFLSTAYVPQRLRRLDLSHNLIGILTGTFGEGLKNVEWLSLRSNIINEIYPRALANASRLRQLDLSHNKLRQLKEATFQGSKFENLTSLSLASNKLTVVRAAELEHLRALTELDLSGNRLENIPLEFSHWMRRSTIVDLRQNPLVCPCELVPFVAWLDSVPDQQRQKRVQARGQLAQRATGEPSSQQLLRSNQIMAETRCAKPEPMSLKSIMQLPATAAELECDTSLIEQADKFKRFRAPVQLIGAEAGEQRGQLRLAWQTVDSQLDLTHFILIRSRLDQRLDLASLRSARRPQGETLGGSAGTGASTTNVEQLLFRLPYNQRLAQMADFEPSSHYVICVSYETLDWQSKLIGPDQVQVSLNSSLASFASLVADYNRYHCADLRALLEQEQADGLVSAGSSLEPSFGVHILMLLVPLGQLFQLLMLLATLV